MTAQPNCFKKKLLHVTKLAFAIIVAASTILTSKAASFYWTGTGSTASAPAGGNWDNATTDWSTTPTGLTGTAWGAAGSLAYFGGADGTYSVSVNATVNKPLDMVFNNSGYTLLNTTTPQTISFNGNGSGAAPNIVVAAGKVATIGTNITITGATLLWGFTNSGVGGELDIQNGGTLTGTGGTVGMVGAGTVTSVKPGGKLIHNAGAAGSFLLGSTINDNCTLSVDGGTVSISANNSGVKVGGNSSAVV
ncbi:MAG: hypothetical protein JF609_01030, partial [Verrucomicrobia bacterium]|nr:hypothetical protein [Verrucomicrobiota bacterium]